MNQNLSKPELLKFLKTKFDLLKQSLPECELANRKVFGGRCANWICYLPHCGIDTLVQLLEWPKDDLLKFRNMGRKTIEVVDNFFITKIGLPLGTKIPEKYWQFHVNKLVPKPEHRSILFTPVKDLIPSIYIPQGKEGMTLLQALNNMKYKKHFAFFTQIVSFGAWGTGETRHVSSYEFRTKDEELLRKFTAEQGLNIEYCSLIPLESKD